MRIPLPMVIRVRPILPLYGSHVPSQPYLPPPHAVCNYTYMSVISQGIYRLCLYINIVFPSITYSFHLLLYLLPSLLEDLQNLVLPTASQVAG